MENLLLAIDPGTVDWSRAQFALTAIYHWLFVPLTLGLAVVMGIMETCYYRTRKEFWRTAARFWQRLFGINFAMGVATGIILEFEFGTNWSNYSWFVGDIFWSTTCHRGNPGFLYGVNLCCSDVLRLEQGISRLPPRFNMAHWIRSNYLSMVDSRG